MTTIVVLPPEIQEEIKVLIVDDHPIVRQGLAQLINRKPDMVVCGEAEEDQHALEQIEAKKPEIALVDLTLKGSSGMSLIKQIKERFPQTHVIVVSMHDESLYAERALRAGAAGYVMKQEATDKVLTAIDRVLQGHIYVSDKIANQMMRRVAGRESDHRDSDISKLTDRELEVFQLIGQGHGTRQIAEMLHRGIKTIETFRGNIKKKLHLSSSTELVKHAVHWMHQHVA